MRRFLVVVDMQNDFVDGALGTAEAVRIIPNAVRKIENFVGDVFVTYDTHFSDYLETAEGRKLPVPHCIIDTDGWQLNDTIADALEGRVFVPIHKPTFGSVQLAVQIAEVAQGDEFSVELIGLCTDICVVSNALLLKAFFPEAEISVDSSCCAGVTPELHEAALKTLASCQINVV